jgi:DNA-directed RNA polymerase subunit H (RpoH/RPB5)
MSSPNVAEPILRLTSPDADKPILRLATAPQLLPIEISYDKQKYKIIKNIIKMLVARNVLHVDNLKDYAAKVFSEIKDDDTCDILIDNVKSDDKQLYKIVLLLDQHITTITKSSLIGDYLYKNIDMHKIIVVDQITQRARSGVQNNFPLIEIFLKDEMMFDITKSAYVPTHILLSDEEAERFISEYGLQKKEIPRILISDPMARYFKAKLGQIFRIIRPSETSGESNFYRIVVKETIVKNKK